MSLFFILAKKALKKQILACSKQSVNKDSSWLNTAATFFGAGRNTELSSAKQEQYVELIVAIQGLEEGASDDLSLVRMMEIILTFKKNTKVLSTRMNYDEGSFGDAMDNLIKLFTVMEEKLKTMRLWDMPMSSMPFELFCFQAAAYEVHKILDDLNPTTLKSIVKNPQVSNGAQFTKEKSDLLYNALSKCRRSLPLLDVSNPKYEDGVKEAILAVIKEVCEENERASTRYGINWTLPVNLTFFISFDDRVKIKRGTGRLGTHMLLAKEMVSRSTMVYEEINDIRIECI